MCLYLCVENALLKISFCSLQENILLRIGFCGEFTGISKWLMLSIACVYTKTQKHKAESADFLQEDTLRHEKLMLKLYAISSQELRLGKERKEDHCQLS